jgi:hypothetical protein
MSDFKICLKMYSFIFDSEMLSSILEHGPVLESKFSAGQTVDVLGDGLLG